VCCASGLILNKLNANAICSWVEQVAFSFCEQKAWKISCRELKPGLDVQLMFFK